MFQDQRPKKHSLDNVFLVLGLFYSPKGGPMVLLQRELYFPKDPEGGQHFPVGSNFFQGGGGGDPNANFYINPYNLLFSSGVRTPYTPLWIRTWEILQR